MEDLSKRSIIDMARGAITYIFSDFGKAMHTFAYDPDAPSGRYFRRSQEQRKKMREGIGEENNGPLF